MNTVKNTIKMSRRKALVNISLAAGSSVLLSGCALLEAMHRLHNQQVLVATATSDGGGTADTGFDSAPKVGATSSKGSQVARTALSQLGTRYRAGGSSPSKGFDCSGLVWWAYQQNGVNVPRITVDQAYTGSSVALDSLAVGDILVFAQYDSPNSLHTGMVSSNTKFIHAPNSRSNVSEASLHDPYWVKYLTVARRIV